MRGPSPQTLGHPKKIFLAIVGTVWFSAKPRTLSKLPQLTNTEEIT